MSVEIVCQSVADAGNAREGGADRIELCSALALGGLTPTVGLLTAVRNAVPLPIMAMIRPRPGGFVYSSDELDQMATDARLLRENGADGLVFGCLTESRTLDVDACRRLRDLAGDGETVFHRAFDGVLDPIAALERLIELGITRLLTSGSKPTAAEGIPLLRTLVERAADRIEILPGGGIRAHNARLILEATGATQLHLAPLTPISETFPFEVGTQTVIDPDAVRAVAALLKDVVPPA
ncbi:MAG: copper homeostasis protein CutC [Capsulimonadales bacterium]|nr:copper homeostasis protein CutC [Capsulimonadales bacterium]